MPKTIIVKLTKAGNRTGPFTISDNLGNVLGTNIPKSALISGISYSVNDLVSVIIIQSTGRCKVTKMLPITSLNVIQIAAIKFEETNTASIWRHLTNTILYNTYYGNIEPYVIEYPFSYQFHDEILQNVKDFTKAYKYLPIPDGVFNDNARVETNDRWFNKAILYNGQQCSGLLELVPKPAHNLKDYLKYPMYNEESKTITYTKSDSFYQYNTFWSLIKSSQIPMFNVSCESLSIDKVLNQSNMDYGKRSFKKSPLRSKFLLVRHILDNSSDTHLTSGFIITPAQISYK
jgi:hypothetical protein